MNTEAIYNFSNDTIDLFSPLYSRDSYIIDLFSLSVRDVMPTPVQLLSNLLPSLLQEVISKEESTTELSPDLFPFLLRTCQTDLCYEIDVFMITCISNHFDFHCHGVPYTGIFLFAKISNILPSQTIKSQNGSQIVKRQ